MKSLTLIGAALLMALCGPVRVKAEGALAQCLAECLSPLCHALVCCVESGAAELTAEVAAEVAESQRRRGGKRAAKHYKCLITPSCLSKACRYVVQNKDKWICKSISAMLCCMTGCIPWACVANYYSEPWADEHIRDPCMSFWFCQEKSEELFKKYKLKWDQDERKNLERLLDKVLGEAMEILDKKKAAAAEAADQRRGDEILNEEEKTERRKGLTEEETTELTRLVTITYREAFRSILRPRRPRDGHDDEALESIFHKYGLPYEKTDPLFQAKKLGCGAAMCEMFKKLWTTAPPEDKEPVKTPLSNLAKLTSSAPGASTTVETSEVFDDEDTFGEPSEWYF